MPYLFVIAVKFPGLFTVQTSSDFFVFAQLAAHAY